MNFSSLLFLQLISWQSLLVQPKKVFIKNLFCQKNFPNGCQQNDKKK